MYPSSRPAKTASVDIISCRTPRSAQAMATFTAPLAVTSQSPTTAAELSTRSGRASVIRRSTASPSRTSRGRHAHSLKPGGLVRDTPSTSWPKRRTAEHRAEPSVPVAPVIRTRMASRLSMPWCKSANMRRRLWIQKVSVPTRAYRGPMINRSLLDQALRLDEPARRELIVALQQSLGAEEVAPEVAAIIDHRIAEADADPDDSVSLDDFERQIRSRRSA